MSVTRKPNLRFAMVMVGFVGVVLLTYREDVLGPFLAPMTTLTARTTLTLLRWLGIEAVRAATVISHPDGFAYEIYYRCTGILPVAFLTVSVLAYPAPWRCKLTGLAVGLPVLITLNLTRLVHLFYVGMYRRAAFHTMHGVVWEGLLIIATLVLWLGWRVWAHAKLDPFR